MSEVVCAKGCAAGRARGRLGGLGAFTRLTPQLQAAGEIPAGDPGLQGHQLLGDVLQEVGDVGLDVAKTAGDGLGAGEGDVTTASVLASPEAKGLPCPAAETREVLVSEGEVRPPLPLVAKGKHP